MVKKKAMGRPRKYSNEELVRIVQEEYEKIKDTNPTYNDLMYSLMLNRDWLRLRCMDAIGMFMAKTGIKLTNEETEPTTKESEFEEFKKILGFSDDLVQWNLKRMTPEDKEFLREWYRKENTQEAIERRTKTKETLNVFFPWLQQKYGIDKDQWYSFTKPEKKYPIEAEFYEQHPKLPLVGLCGEYPKDHPLLGKFI